MDEYCRVHYFAIAKSRYSRYTIYESKTLIRTRFALRPGSNFPFPLFAWSFCILLGAICACILIQTLLLVTLLQLLHYRYFAGREGRKKNRESQKFPFLFISKTKIMYKYFDYCNGISMP